MSKDCGYDDSARRSPPPRTDDELEAVRKLLIAERDQLKRYKSAVMNYMLSSLKSDADKTLFEFAKAEGLFAEFEACLD